MEDKQEKKVVVIDRKQLQKVGILIFKSFGIAFGVLVIIALFGDLVIGSPWNSWDSRNVNYTGLLGTYSFINEWNASLDISERDSFFVKIYAGYIPLILKCNYGKLIILTIISYVILVKSENYIIKVK
ncbi:hypothetical protein HZP52_07735 [Elizabethkingia anophelis]|uniref:hypothetical protein n=1 Tax=Elizabethkingia anophelis TaxID=1117645 RepID=UPI0021A6E25F|nr:hypothetical protein [Elizabethkingia anophelis]MCT4193878.1 hypothetical protein [Elizabethkingia anophelis]